MHVQQKSGNDDICLRCTAIPQVLVVERRLGGTGGAVQAGKERRAITLQDVRLILPTFLILLFTILIMLTVIPYAFSSVIKQLNAVQAGPIFELHCIHA